MVVSKYKFNTNINTMHYFSISNNHRDHLGFMVLMDLNDDTKANQTQGCFAVKVANDSDDITSAAYRTLLHFSAQPIFFWHKHNDYLQLFDANNTMIGRLQQQFLQLGQQHYLLEDLSGVL